MIQKFIHHLLAGHHYWRNVGFSELAELYTSRLLRMTATNLVAGIVAVYMYQLGYPIWAIILFWALYFSWKGLMAIPSAYFIARIGPKHAALVSNMLNVPALIALTQLEGTGVGALIVFGILQGTAVSMYWIAYHVAFSKVKHPDHAGKELGFMYIVEKIGTGLTPFIGGLIAYIFGPEYTMIAACLLMVASAGPLFLSPEPVMTHQHIIFRGFNWRATWKNMVSSVGVGIDQFASIAMWTIYIAVAILGTTSDIVYAQIGGLMTIAYIASVAFSKLYGLLIDKKRGGELLTASVVTDSLLMFTRPFASSPLGIVFINIINEATTSGYLMPYYKGLYDMADSLPGYRIVYITIAELAVAIGSGVFGLLVVGIILLVGDIRGLQVGYVIAAVLILAIAMHGFPALRRSRI